MIHSIEVLPVSSLIFPFQAPISQTTSITASAKTPGTLIVSGSTESVDPRPGPLACTQEAP